MIDEFADPQQNSRVYFFMQTASPLRVGQVLEFSFPAFTPRITIRSDRELTVEIVAGENTGFSDTVEYQAVAVRDGLVLLSWQEHIGSTIVHVLDLGYRIYRGNAGARRIYETDGKAQVKSTT